MRTELLNYNLGQKIIAVTDEMLANQLKLQSILVIEGHYFVSLEKSFINTIKRGDIVYISESGNVLRVFEAASNSIDIAPTLHCNSNCLVCPHTEDARKKPEDTRLWRNLIELLPNTIHTIRITGGEPTLLGYSLFELIDLLCEKFHRADFIFQSNGRALADKKFAATLINHMPQNTLFRISLFSGNPSVHDEITNSPGSFDQTMCGIRNLVLLGKCVEIHVLVNALNFNSLDELTHHLSTFRGISKIVFSGLKLVGAALANEASVWLPYECVAKAIQGVADVFIENNIDVRIVGIPLCCVDTRYWFLNEELAPHARGDYYEACATCTVKEFCSGNPTLISSTKKPNIIPVV